MNEKSLNIQRTASYRAAVRRSAPIPPEYQKEVEVNHSSKSSEEDLIITSQPTSKTSFDGNVKEDLIVILENGNNKFDNSDDSLKLDKHNQLDNGCSKFCCEKCCCHYCKCCPQFCFDYMKSLESVLTDITDCGLNCIRVFT